MGDGRGVGVEVLGGGPGGDCFVVVIDEPVYFLTEQIKFVFRPQFP